MKQQTTSTNWTCDAGGETTTTTGSRIPAGWGSYNITRTTQGNVLTYSTFDLCPTHVTPFEALVPIPFTNVVP